MNILARLRLLMKDLLIYGTGDLTLKLCGLLTLPIYTRIFPPNEYGIWSLAVALIGMMTTVLILGGNTTYSRFYFDAGTAEEKKTVTSTWFLFLTAWNVLVTLCLLPFAESLSRLTLGDSRYQAIFMISILIVPLSNLNLMFGQILRNEFSAAKFATLNVISNLLTVGCSLVAVLVLHLGLVGLAGGMLASLLIMLPIRIWDTRKAIRFQFSFPVLKKMLSFSLPLVPMSMAYWIFGSSDRFLLSKLSSADQVGLYGVAISLTAGLSFISNSLGQAWAPHALEAYEKQEALARQFFGNVLNYILVGFGFLCVALTAFSREVMVLLSTPSYYSASKAIGPLALGIIALATTQVTALGISLSKKTHYFITCAWFAAILNVLLNILWIPKWGLLASSWATAISYAALSFAYAIVSQKLWPMIYDFRKISLSIALTVAFTLEAERLPSVLGFETFLLKCLYLVLFITLVFLLRIVNPNEFFKNLSRMRKGDVNCEYL